MGFFKKKNKKQKEEFVYIDPGLDIDAEFKKRRQDKADNSDKEFRDIEGMQYIHTQCQLITESSGYIAELKTEYDAVSAYLSDIQIIESQSEIDRKRLRMTAQEVAALRQRRDSLHKEKPKLKASQYAMFDKYAKEFPRALSDMQNDEKYCSAVKHDLRVLEAEKMSLKEEIDNAGTRRTNIRNISIISLLGIIAVFIIFFVSHRLGDKSGMVLFMVVLLLCAVYVLLIFFMQRRTLYRQKLAEKKLARAITLLNKTKIKYVNIVNSVEYKQEKYGVKNSYELSRIYEIYLDEQKKSERFRSFGVELEDAHRRLTELVSGMGLYDASVWNSQIEALIEQKAMKALRASLNSRRQKLRERMEYNAARIEDSKKSIMDYLKRHSDRAEAIMEIVEGYDAL
ncbi:MAG: hypothetical protein NC223_08385 [Butyrivibrio sp.]|nr:hypothetical protein [Butyrivibrio sp.]